MAALTVTFEVPARILKGLEDGTLRRVGGVIVNSQGGGVVAWLREGGACDLAGNMPLGLGALSLGLQATTLAVSVVGFSLLHARLKGIQRQLTGLASALAEQKRSGEWRDWKEMVVRFVPVVASIEMLNGVRLVSPETTRQAMTVMALGELGKAKEYYRQVVMGILDQRREVHRVGEFEASYRAWVAAGSAHVRAAQGLGANLAANLCGSFLDSHHEFAKELRAAIGDYTRVLGVADRERTTKQRRALYEQASQVEEIFRGHLLQLEWETNNGVSSSEFEPDPDRVGRHDGVVTYQVDYARIG